MTLVRRFDVVLFDLGSTLLYYDGDWAPVLHEMDVRMYHSLHVRSYALDEVEFVNEYFRGWVEYDQRRKIDHTELSAASVLRKVLARFGYAEPPEADVRAALAASYAVSQARWRLEADALPMLDSLRANGYRLGMVSNASDAQDVHTLLERNQLTPYFEIVVISAEQGVRKPDPRIFQPALDYFNASPERVVMVGDTLNADVLGAHRTGLFSVWLKRRADRPDNQACIHTIFPDAVIQTLAELPTALQQPDLFAFQEPGQ